MREVVNAIVGSPHDLSKIVRRLLLGWSFAAVAGLTVLGWLASAGMLWWDITGIAEAQARKAAPQAEVAEMQANRDERTKTVMFGEIVRCNPGNRPCIRVNEGAGAFGDRGDYRVTPGY